MYMHIIYRYYAESLCCGRESACQEIVGEITESLRDQRIVVYVAMNRAKCPTFGLSKHPAHRKGGFLLQAAQTKMVYDD